MRTETDRAGRSAVGVRAAQRLLEVARRDARSGSTGTAWAACLEAAAVGRRTGDAHLVARAAIVLADHDLLAWRTAAERQALCLEALGMLGPSGTGDATTAQLRDRVAAQLASLTSGWSVEPSSPVRAALAPDAAADRLARVRAEHAHLAGPGAAERRLELAAESVSLGRAAGDDDAVAWGALWGLDGLVRLGRRLEFNRALGAFSGLVERLDVPVWRWRLANVHAGLALLEDRPDDVEAALAEARREAAAAKVRSAGYLDLIHRSALAQRTGVRLAELEREVAAAIADAPLFAQGWRAQLLLDLGRTEEAVAIWRTLAPQLEALPTDSDEWFVATAGHARLAIAADDHEGAAAVLEQLRPFAGQHIAGPAETPYGGPVSLVLARLAVHLGDRAAAAVWAADAVSDAERMVAPHYAALARALPIERRTLGPLSPRETEVARCIVDGASNRVIAEELFLSERTVEQHVRSILRKLGAPNRAAVAGWVVRHADGR
ncbi:helix-turn-helix transcriptional regulator [Agromyces seonyuensis]|nr:LuxR C-terminal-related transcriptional regulator [Agromyces seonyuensis]